MDYISLHDVLNECGGGRFAFEDDIPRIVSLGDDPDQFIVLHYNQGADIFFSHSCHSIEYCGIRTNGPNASALLSKNICYGHGGLPWCALRRATTHAATATASCRAPLVFRRLDNNPSILAYRDRAQGLEDSAYGFD